MCPYTLKVQAHPPRDQRLVISSKGSFICTMHQPCYTSCGVLAGTTYSSMGPPWRIDPITHRTSRSPFKSEYHPHLHHRHGNTDVSDVQTASPVPHWPRPNRSLHGSLTLYVPRPPRHGLSEHEIIHLIHVYQWYLYRVGVVFGMWYTWSQAECRNRNTIYT